MEKPSFLSLSDEVLLYIFSYLGGIDKINTSSTCVRFSNVMCDRRLARKLKLMGNYSVTVKSIKYYLKPKMMQENIRILDLTNCYWLQPSQVCATVLKLQNLIAFYSVGVAFTGSQITKLFVGIPKMECVSFSWPEDPNLKLEVLNSLVFLYIYFPKVVSVDWLHVFSWACKCGNIKQLWLICDPCNPSCRVLYYSTLRHSELVQMTLDTLVVVDLRYEDILQELQALCNIPPDTCKCLWLQTHAFGWVKYFKVNKDVHGPRLNTSWGKCLENLAYEKQGISFGKNRKIKKLYWYYSQPPSTYIIQLLLHGKSIIELKDKTLSLTLNSLCNVAVSAKFSAGEEQFEELEALKTQICFCLTLLQPLNMLTVLSIPACCFTGPKGEQKEGVKLLPKWCPKIQHFEIILCENCRITNLESKHVLEMIAEWPKLKTLKLSDCWILRSGKVFDKIFRCCTYLEKLFVKNLGALCGYMFEFTKALKQCKNLKDFRLEENFVPPVQMRWLFEALTECPLIERVALVFQNNDKSPTDELVLNLIEKSSKLIFLCIITPSMVDAQKKRLMKKITTQFTPTRPALHCWFLKCLSGATNRKLPAVHLFEMLYPDKSGPFQLPYTTDSFFEVPDLHMTTT